MVHCTIPSKGQRLRRSRLSFVLVPPDEGGHRGASDLTFTKNKNCSPRALQSTGRISMTAWGGILTPNPPTPARASSRPFIPPDEDFEKQPFGSPGLGEFVSSQPKEAVVSGA